MTDYSSHFSFILITLKNLNFGTDLQTTGFQSTNSLNENMNCIYIEN